MSKQLKRVISLAKKTGDRIVVFDNSEPDDSFVVISLDQYEKLIDQFLTEKKIIDRIDSIENDNHNPKNNWKIPPEIKEKSEE